jgi:hypothetical protein
LLLLLIYFSTNHSQQQNDARAQKAFNSHKKTQKLRKLQIRKNFSFLFKIKRKMRAFESIDQTEEHGLVKMKPLAPLAGESNSRQAARTVDPEADPLLQAEGGSTVEEVSLLNVF